MVRSPVCRVVYGRVKFGYRYSGHNWNNLVDESDEREGEKEMTDQEQIEYVVEKLGADVFCSKDGASRLCGSGGADASRACYNEVWIAWIEKKLMAWLEDEERGYFFRREHTGVWSWIRSGGVHWQEESSQWQALYAAFEHWQEQQKPKEKTRREEVSETVLDWFGYTPEHEDHERRISSIMSIFPEPDLEGLRGEVEMAVGQYRLSDITPNAEHRKCCNAIMSAVEKHAKGGG